MEPDLAFERVSTNAELSEIIMEINDLHDYRRLSELSLAVTQRRHAHGFSQATCH
jgi:hypothetical protein